MCIRDSPAALFACGRQSIRLPVPVYIRSSASVVGSREKQGPLGELFDFAGEDDLFGCDTWEDAESSLQRDALHLALQKAGLHSTDIRYLFAGDLLGQSIATSFGLMQYERPLFGLYGACEMCIRDRHQHRCKFHIIIHRRSKSRTARLKGRGLFHPVCNDQMILRIACLLYTSSCV